VTGGKVAPELVEAHLAHARTHSEEHSLPFDAIVDLVRDSARDGLDHCRELLSRPLEAPGERVQLHPVLRC